MCLNNISFAGKAKHDITCYKVLSQYRDDTNMYTPFEDTLVPKTCITGKSPFAAICRPWETPPKTPAEIKLRGEITYGFIHTYKSLEDIKKEKDFYCWLHDRQGVCVVIFKCVIPKGTLYCEGTSENINVITYASKQIKFVKVINMSDFLKTES